MGYPYKVPDPAFHVPERRILTQEQSDFFWLDCKFPAFIGGFGCMHGDTKIWTENGLKCISDVSGGERVLSWRESDNQLVLSPSSGSFPKGRAYLRRVSTARGSFLAAPDHKFLFADNSYKKVKGLTKSTPAYQLPSDLLQFLHKSDIEASFPDIEGITIGAVNTLIYYGSMAREHGQKFIYRDTLSPDFNPPICGDVKLNPGPVKLDKELVVETSKKRIEEAYWDLHVLHTNNYICENGFIHHNSGKTEVLLARGLRDKFMWPQSTIAMYEPTYDLARLILIPRLLEALELANVHYVHNKSENIIYLLNKGKFIIRTLDNPSRIVGYESFRSHIDEIDTLPEKQATEAWYKIVARNRQKLPGAPLNQICIYTTPEGYKFVYKKWGNKPKEQYKHIKASSYTNLTNLPDDYIQGLLDSYPAHLVVAYIEGEFTNLTSGSVYRQFHREENHSDEKWENTSETLHVGQDFNVGRGCLVIHVIRDQDPIAIGEIVGTLDTPQSIKILKEKYPNNPIMIYPDATGKSRKSQNVSQSDIQQLKDAGFTVRKAKKNPLIKDRVMAFNALICNALGERRYKVNTSLCPHLTDALEQQVYDKNGVPEKGEGKGDDINDAAGYFVYRKWPIKRRRAQNTRLSGI